MVAVREGRLFHRPPRHYGKWTIACLDHGVAEILLTNCVAGGPVAVGEVSSTHTAYSWRWESEFPDISRAQRNAHGGEIVARNSKVAWVVD